MKSPDCSQYCPEEDYLSRCLCEPLGKMLGWDDCAATREVLAQARTGNPAAEFILGTALEQQGGETAKLAVRWYRRSAQKGYSPAEKSLAGFSSQIPKPSMRVKSLEAGNRLKGA